MTPGAPDPSDQLPLFGASSSQLEPWREIRQASTHIGVEPVDTPNSEAKNAESISDELALAIDDVPEVSIPTCPQPIDPESRYAISDNDAEDFHDGALDYLAHLRASWCDIINTLHDHQQPIAHRRRPKGWRESLTFRAGELRRVTAGALAEYADAFGDEASTLAWTALKTAIRPNCGVVNDLTWPLDAVHPELGEPTSQSGQPRIVDSSGVFPGDAMSPSNQSAPPSAHPADLADAVDDLRARARAARAGGVPVDDAWIQKEVVAIAGEYRTESGVAAFAEATKAELLRQGIPPLAAPQSVVTGPLAPRPRRTIG